MMAVTSNPLVLMTIGITVAGYESVTDNEDTWLTDVSDMRRNTVTYLVIAMKLLYEILSEFMKSDKVIKL